MANPQKENGHTPIANELMEALAGVSLNGTQFRLVMVILRKTYGWNKKMDTIGLLQFCEVTGLPKKLVSRELNRLAKRQIIAAWGDDHHPKQYGIQKDHTRWLEEEAAEVSTNQGTPCAKVSTKTSQSVYQSVDEVSTNQGTTKDSKAIKGSVSHETGSAPPVRRGTLRQQFQDDYTAAVDQSKRIAVAANYFEKMLGPPEYGRVGRLLKDAGSGGAFFEAISEAARQTLTDDPHSYVSKVIKRRNTEQRRGREGQADMNSGKKQEFVQ